MSVFFKAPRRIREKQKRKPSGLKILLDLSCTLPPFLLAGDARGGFNASLNLGAAAGKTSAKASEMTAGVDATFSLGAPPSAG